MKHCYFVIILLCGLCGPGLLPAQSSPLTGEKRAAKLSPNLVGLPRAGLVTYGIALRSDSLLPAFRAGLPPAARMVDYGHGLLWVTAPVAIWKENILPDPAVIYVGQEALHPQPESRVIGLDLSVNTITTLHHEQPTLDGRGLTLAIQELRFDSADLDLQGRSRPSPFAAAYSSRHATDMATIAAGAGNSFLTGRGVAPAAHLVSTDFSKVLPQSPNWYRAMDIGVQNHAYGTAVEPFYGMLAAAYDESARDVPTLLHVFSAGNRGDTTPVGGTYRGLPGWSNLTGNFKHSKNTLTVGTIDTAQRVVAYSSRGPAYDGRVKPELVAYCGPGTSNSAALVSGLAILLQQTYRELYGALPPAALLKAVLINSARDVGPAGIDFLTGYGSVDGRRAVRLLEEGNFHSGQVGPGETVTYTLSIPPGARNLRLTLAWSDPAAKPNSSTALMNDLDLWLEDATGNRWQPWVLDTRPSATALAAAPQRGTDRLNNIEQVTVAIPAPGRYTVHIRGYRLATPNQAFQLAYQWDDADAFRWTFPTANDQLPYLGEAATYLRWESTLGDTLGTIEYSIDGGRQWQQIAANVDLRAGQLRWAVPEVRARAVLRLRTADQRYPTDTFSIARPLRVQTGFVCGDSLLLHWSPLPFARGYAVYTLPVGSPSLVQIAQTNDTLLVLPQQALAQRLYAVAPLLADGRRGTPGYSYDYTLQGVDCYFSTFHAATEAARGIGLHLQLGTTYGLRRIIYERQQGTGFVEIANLPASSAASYWLDAEAPDGLNTYRVRLELNNGRTIFSDDATAYIVREQPYAVFPNPLPRDEYLNVFSRTVSADPAARFALYDAGGRFLVSYPVDELYNSFLLTGLPAGLYFYAIDGVAGALRGRIVLE